MWRHDNRIHRFLVRASEKLKAESKADELPFQGIRRDILRIAELKEPEQRRTAFRKTFSKMRPSLALTWCVENRQTLRTKGADVWSGLPIHLFGEALDVFEIQRHDESEWATDFIVLIPALARFRPDLLLRAHKVIGLFKDDHIRAIAYSNLAYFLEGEQQKTLIELALESASSQKRDRDSEWTCGLVLEDVAEYAPQSILAHIARYFVDCNKTDDLVETYQAALNAIARRIDDMKLLETIWPVAEKLGARCGAFICAVSPHLSPEWLAKLVIFSSQRVKMIDYVYPCLCDRWIRLPRHEAHEVWCKVINTLSTRPRHEFLHHIGWFLEAIVYLGEEQAAADTGEGILEVGRWWP
jgi:hypothetical protein